MLLPALAAARAAAWEAAKAPADLESFAGARVHVELMAGETLRDVELVKLRHGSIPGTVVSVTLSAAGQTSRRVLGAAAVKRIDAVGGGPLLQFDEVAKTLVRPGDKNLEAIRKAALESQESAVKPGPKPKNKQKPAPGPDEPEPGQAAPPLTEAERQEFFKKTGVWLWPELTEAQQGEAVARHKEFLEKVGEAIPQRQMRLNETKFFLFFTDLPSQQATAAVSGLDKMYQEQCKAFGVTPGKNIWLGKQTIVAFRDQPGFARFEKEFFQREAGEALGRSHLRPDGSVVVACWAGNDAAALASALAHETTHGFMYRHKSSRPLPSWIEEGAAEFMAALIVPDCRAVQQDQQRALARLRETKNLRGNFFTADKIETWQYGVASSLAEFMLRWDAKRYRAMIDGVKEGLGWEESLKKAYRVTPEELVQKYGRQIGVPDLKP